MNLPVLYVVWNNSRRGAVASATRMGYPDGWTAKTDNFPFSDLGPSLDFELVCQAAGGYGEKVVDPAEVPAAFERALMAAVGKTRSGAYRTPRPEIGQSRWIAGRKVFASAQAIPERRR